MTAVRRVLADIRAFLSDTEAWHMALTVVCLWHILTGR